MTRRKSDESFLVHPGILDCSGGGGAAAGGRRWSTATQSVAGQSMASHQSLHTNEHGGLDGDDGDDGDGDDDGDGYYPSKMIMF